MRGQNAEFLMLKQVVLIVSGVFERFMYVGTRVRAAQAT
jgi:hypothetical protein